jgi:endoglucanase
MQMDWGPVHNAAVTSDFAWIVSPENDSQPVYILDDEPQTTAAVSGSFAMASMVFRDVDTGRADELLRDAKKAYEAFDKTEISVDKSNPWNIVAGDYKNNSILDEWFFAASALYAATHESRYLNDAMQIFLNDPNLEYGLTYSEMSGYGSFLLLQDEEFKQTEYYESLRNSFLGFANSLMSMQYENGYSVAAGSYYWGSNMGVANYSMIFLMANEIQSDQRLIDAAQQQISYLLGCNGMNMSYVTGYGDKYPNNIHHRLSMVKEQLLLGALVGGPDMGTGLTCPPAKCYIDQNDMYSMNEVAIYYNSPLIFSLAGIIANQ